MWRVKTVLLLDLLGNSTDEFVQDQAPGLSRLYRTRIYRLFEKISEVSVNRMMNIFLSLFLFLCIFDFERKLMQEL